MPRLFLDIHIKPVNFSEKIIDHKHKVSFELVCITRVICLIRERDITKLRRALNYKGVLLHNRSVGTNIKYNE